MARSVRWAFGMAALLPLLGQAGRWWAPLDLVNAMLVPLLALLLLAGVIALRLRWWREALLLGFALVVGAAQLGSAILVAAPVRPGAGGLRVLSISAFHANPTPAALARMIEQSRADLVLVQEADGTAADAVARALPQFHRVHSCAAPPCSLVILSRWPLARVAAPTNGTGPLPDLLAAQIAHPRGAFVAITLHLPRPTRTEALRHREALLAMVAQLRGVPLLVGGDYNLATGTLALAEFEREARLARHDPFISTWPADIALPPFFALDHLHASPHWQSHGCQAVPPVGSDHRGLLCSVSR